MWDVRDATYNVQGRGKWCNIQCASERKRASMRCRSEREVTKIQWLCEREVTNIQWLCKREVTNMQWQCEKKMTNLQWLCEWEVTNIQCICEREVHMAMASGGTCDQPQKINRKIRWFIVYKTANQTATSSPPSNHRYLSKFLKQRHITKPSCNKTTNTTAAPRTTASAACKSHYFFMESEAQVSLAGTRGHNEPRQVSEGGRSVR